MAMCVMAVVGWPHASASRRAGTRPHHPGESPRSVHLRAGPAAPSRDDESLTEWMRMPCSPRAGLESYAGTLNEPRIACLKKRINPRSASEPL